MNFYVCAMSYSYLSPNPKMMKWHTNTKNNGKTTTQPIPPKMTCPPRTFFHRQRGPKIFKLSQKCPHFNFPLIAKKTMEIVAVGPAFVCCTPADAFEFNPTSVRCPTLGVKKSFPLVDKCQELWGENRKHRGDDKEKNKRWKKQQRQVEIQQQQN